MCLNKTISTIVVYLSILSVLVMFIDYFQDRIFLHFIQMDKIIFFNIIQNDKETRKLVLTNSIMSTDFLYLLRFPR